MNELKVFSEDKELNTHFQVQKANGKVKVRPLNVRKYSYIPKV